MPRSSIPITLWPGTLLLPAAYVIGEDLESEQLPEEWVIRDLFDLDLDNDDELSAVLRERGRITWPYPDRSRVPPARRHLLAFGEPPDPEIIDWEGRRYVNHKRDLAGRRMDGTLEDARWWLKTLRALVGMWRLASFGRSPAEAWGAEGFLSTDEQGAWRLLVAYLNTGLEPFQARVIPSSRERTAGIFPVELYSAGCQQLFNFIVTGATPRQCENATCGRTFVHQLGGEGNWHRTKGLRFCSPECARAEAQRQYRRRKKEQR